MAVVQMITWDRVGCATVPVEVEVCCREPLQTTAKSVIAAGAKKFKAVTKQSRAYHGLTGLELTGNVELSCLNGTFIVLSGKAGWKGAAHISAAHEKAKLADKCVESHGGEGSNDSVAIKANCTSDPNGDDKLACGSNKKVTQDILLEAAQNQRASGVVLVWKDTQDNGYLSNWGRSPILIDGVSYNCVEQWLMACKARACNNESVREQIMATPNPRKQKELGRSLDKKIVDRCWNLQQKWDAQLKGAMAKFQQNESLAVKLLRTGQKLIAEASPSDCIYGIGLAPSNPLAQDPANWKGMNLLGKALERVREDIRHCVLAGEDLASMVPQATLEKPMPLTQEFDLPSSGPESASDIEEDGPCILIVHNKRPFNDWAAALGLYLQTRFQLRARALSINVQRIGLLDRLELENPVNVIIPVGREVTEIVAARGWNSRVCTPELYSMLDHKGNMTSLNFPNSVPMIPTHVNSPTFTSGCAELLECRSFVSQHQTVIIKPAEEAGSKGQRILSREQVEDLFEKHPTCFRDTVVQPYLKNHITLEFNFFALDGELLQWLCTYASGGITEDMWAKGTSLQTYDGEELSKIVLFVREAIRLHQLQGLMEFEFLISDGQVFFLEINPRISSSLACFDSQGFSPYIEKLVVPCLQSFGWLKDHEVDHWQAPCVFCPPEERAKQFWQETYQKDHMGKGDNV